MTLEQVIEKINIRINVLDSAKIERNAAMQQLNQEIKTKEAEIAFLQEQVNFHVSQNTKDMETHANLIEVKRYLEMF